MKVLIVEDDTKIASIIKRTLRDADYVSDHASNAPESLSLFSINNLYITQ